MKSFSHFLIEKRRNPISKKTGLGLNPKISLWDKLEKYRNEKDIYISFVADVGKLSHEKFLKKSEKEHKRKSDISFENNITSISGYKLGINPKSIHNTPLGIYTFPVKKAIKIYGNSRTRSFNVPEYVRYQPGIFFIRPKGKVIDLVNMKLDEMNRHKKSLVKMLNSKKNGDKKIIKKEVEALMQWAIEHTRIRSYGGMFWNMTRCAAEYLTGNVKLETNDEGKIRIISVIGSNPGEESRKSHAARLKTSNTWRRIFLELGFIGATDNHADSGIVHPNEPMQAVFFDTKAIEIVDFSLNKNYAPNKVDKTKTKWINYPNDAGKFSNLMSAVYAVYEAQDYEFDYGKAKWNILNLSYVTMYRNRVLEGDKEMWIKIHGSFHDILETTPEEWKNKKLMEKKWGDGMLEDSVCIYSVKDDSADPEVEIDMEYVTFRLPKGKKFADGKTTHSADHFKAVIKGGIKNYLEKLFDGVK